DPAFIRAMTTPRRGVGQATLQALGASAARRGVSLFEAGIEADETELPMGRQREAVHGFVRMIQGLQARAAGRGEDGAGQVLDDLLAAIDDERHLYDTLDDRQAQARWTHVLELAEWLKRKAGEDDMTLLELVQHVALV